MGKRHARSRRSGLPSGQDIFQFSNSLRSSGKPVFDFVRLSIPWARYAARAGDTQSITDVSELDLKVRNRAIV